MASPTSAQNTPFNRIGPYVESLRKLTVAPSANTDWAQKCHAALNGEASRMLRSEISLTTRRKFGAFFTGSSLSSSLVDHLVFPKSGKVVYYDPTCGMGDLLLSAAKKLPLRSTLMLTLKDWGQQLTGSDLHQEFIDAAKFRILLLARQRHGEADGELDPSIDYFPNIRVANALDDINGYQNATHVLMNPPFGTVKVGKNHCWTSGSVTAAAVFVVDALEKVREKTQVIAILPEVLRSGSFSQNWQNAICQIAAIELIKPYGVFDESADIDVFLLSLIKRRKSQPSKLNWSEKSKDKKTPTLGDHFFVHVGRVVPHRDPEKGEQLPYIHPRSIEPWTVVSEISETRQHHAPGYASPFVVIRRTSRPEQRYRAIASVVTNGIVYVENHLIVCEPKNGSLESCLRLMKELKSESVNTYLNDRIRCRHLTVGSVSAIPIEAWQP